uniref:2',3'-cyclic nucleotide 3' phosphodiesterase n=2 Tax=Canis lupus familiaris TaxID=9615 RepID=A0A8C0S2A9_CANLF
MLSLGMSPERRLSWSPTLGRDPQACCTAQPSSVTTGRLPGQTSMPSRMW